ncbi:hypothetical protein AFCA_008559 [Aspergillus flavus]|uniref:Uncharacterized protein n=1 Tax=Aspergillus flavus TaxID=5059 RepID=A0A0A1VAY3_ASPFL|nr:hypothetical protein COH20_006416 [Aspergillus flavus]RAQ80533.1 hypothetical protein COH21_004826 [Aspergillus flavus]RMZ48441.1 hypothetical protein CA14_009427 [Aspergillus flavus]UDD61176.1 hypothetical protein AFCA_008559 [Aspergillus flavus]FAA01144.1 TPA: hypothetical protein [Aspergillus flavus]
MSDLYAHRESDEYLLKPEHFAEKKNRPKRWDCLRPIIYTSLAFVGFIEILFFGIFFAQVTRKTPERLLGELNGLVGDFPARRVIFRSDPLAASDHKTEESRNATMNNWLSYMPRGNGFIAVNQTERYTLPPPIKQLGQDTYSIAVFHQLHCLYAIMSVYDDLAAAKSAADLNAHHSRDDTHSNEHPHEQVHVHSHDHVDHCFQYLRQSLLCCGDTALEGQDPRTDNPGTDGTGAVHICKDFEGILAWADSRRLVDAKHN